ncbi:PDZ domain-containing protein [Pseudomonas sp. NPDC099000]|uniref:PDZ domain-containing protein n=1 Tax=Pseudomonas sp. NPDC099000 TaxID=3364488 RepID=UPI00383A941E
MNKHATKFIALAFFYAALSGCANNNPYTNHYSALNGSTPENIAKFRSTPPPEIPVVDNVSPEQGQERLDMWARRGYIAIGKASFNSPQPIPEKFAVDQAKAVKADLIVIRSPRYTGSYATSTAVVKPTISTTEGSALLMGAPGRTNAIVKGTGTTITTTTDYVPTTEHRADYAAVYFIKRTVIFGVNTADLTDKERQERQSNYGVRAIMLTDDSPAYNADILVGDILEALDNEKIKNTNHLSTMIATRLGKKVDVTLSRNGKTITKSIQFNSQS